MAKFRKPKKDRKEYPYYDAYKKEVGRLKPGEDGVTKSDVAEAYEFDDEASRVQDYETHNGFVRYDHPVGGKRRKGQPDILADTSADAQNIFEALQDALDQSEQLVAFWDSLSERRRRIVKLKLRGLTKVAIGKEEGISEAAVRKHLKKIQEILKNYLS
jgi:DNA-directed RNA polymerase specialized sigma subunit